MRVAYLASRYPAVSHTFIRREIQALRACGAEIETFALRGTPPSELRAEADQRESESTFTLLPAPPFGLALAHLRALLLRPAAYLGALASALRHRTPGARALLWSLFHFAEAIWLARELERRGLRHLHVHFANAAADVGRIAARFLGIGWSLTLHGSADFDAPTRDLLGAKLAEVRFAVCVSDYGRAQAQRAADPAHWAKLGVVRCGLDLKRVPPVSARGAPPVVLCVGRLSPEKGHVGLVEAFAELRRSGSDARLRLVGEGPERGRIAAAAARLGVAEHVALPGSATEEEVRAELARADVFALASFMEGLPVSALEAMAQSVAVVAPRVAGVPELVIDGDTGRLFTPGRWDELARALGELLRDPVARERMAARGRAKVEAEYEIERCVQPLYERLCEEPGTREGQ